MGVLVNFPVASLVMSFYVPLSYWLLVLNLQYIVFYYGICNSSVYHSKITVILSVMLIQIFIIIISYVSGYLNLLGH